VKLGWLPTSGYTHPSQSIVDNVKGLILPALSLAVGQIAAYMRLLRSDMIATLQEDYILMAKSKGIPTRRVLWRHALRPSSLTLLTVAGLNIGALIGGTIVVENLFGIPGMGQLLYFAIFGRQFVELQSLVAVIAIGYVLVNVAVDVLYTVLDPRIRDARALA
jgi:peptide/nickel transport system permease protein